MKVTIPGYSSLTGSPETILRLMQDANVVQFSEEVSGAEAAENILRFMAENQFIIIEE